MKNNEDNDNVITTTTTSTTPELLFNFFVKNSIPNMMQLRNTETDLLLSLKKTSNGQKGISYRGSKLWNQLDHNISQAPFPPPSSFLTKITRKFVMNSDINKT